VGGNKLYVLIALLLVVTLSFVSADLSLVVTGEINGESTDFYLKTNEYASVGYDGYDLEVPSFPESVPTLYSILGSRNLIIDNWPSSDRDIILGINIPSNPVGQLELSFGDIDDSFEINLFDCGSDDSCESIIEENTITGGATYEVANTENYRYFKLGVDYYYCGDSICSDSESCSSCSTDCGTCSSGGSSGGGGGGSGDDSVASGLQQLSKDEFKVGYKATLGVNQGFTFPVGSETHSLKVNSISLGMVNVTISSDPITLIMLKGTSQLVDVDADGSRDLNVTVPNVFSSGAEILIRMYNEPVFQFLEADDEDDGAIEDAAEAIVEAKVGGIPALVVVLFSVGLLMLISGAIVLIVRSREPKKAVSTYNLPQKLESSIN
jgi:hypothetical protein